MKDIVPELLELLEREFKLKINDDKIIVNLVETLKENRATFKDANDYAIKLGEILAKVFKENLSDEVLPDGKMYYNIAERILNTTLTNNYNKVIDYSGEVQEILNKQSGLRLKSQNPEINQDRINGIIERLSKSESYEEIAWILQEPIINFTQAIVDDVVKSNVKFHAKLGLKPKINRKVVGGCCDWCSNLAGTYEYPNVPRDIYRRHRFCRCTVDYHPGDGKIQNVHTKRWK